MDRFRRFAVIGNLPTTNYNLSKNAALFLHASYNGCRKTTVLQTLTKTKPILTFVWKNYCGYTNVYKQLPNTPLIPAALAF